MAIRTQLDGSVCSQEHISGFDVTMNHGIPMQKLERFTQLLANAANLQLLQRPLQFQHDPVDRAPTTELDVHLKKRTAEQRQLFC